MLQLRDYYLIFAILIFKPTVVKAQRANFPIGKQFSQQRIQNFSTKQTPGFIENKGQITDQHGNLRPDVNYIYNAPGFKVIFKKNGFSYEVFTIEHKPSKKSISESTGKSLPDHFLKQYKEPEEITVKTHRIDVELTGSNQNPQVVPEEKSADYNNYYLAHTPEEGVQKVYNYSKLIYKNIWKNIDLVFYAKKDGELKYDIVVNPGAKLADIKFAYKGAHKISLQNAKLDVSTSLGSINESIPHSYNIGGKNVEINYNLKNNSISFKGRYNKNQTLVIDPVISWSTYFGGTEHETSFGISVDKNSYVHVVGSTQSTTTIATSGTYQTAYAGNQDFFITKFNSDGAKQWGTYFGSNGIDGHWLLGGGICNDLNGNVFISGATTSTSGIATSGAHQTTYGGGDHDGVIAKFNSSGIRQWSSYLGGDDQDICQKVKCDASGNLYVTGYTKSNSAIATSGTHQTSYGGNLDAYLVKFNNSGSRQWGSYLGGTDIDWGYDLECDVKGDIYVSGWTKSKTSITTTGTHKTAFFDSDDAFLVKFNSSGLRIWGTYFGGNDMDDAYAICTDKNNSIYILGSTRSTNGIATNGAHQTYNGGGNNNSNEDIYVAKFNNSGKLVWGSYYGGSGQENAGDISSDTLGNIFITSSTGSKNGISTKGAYKDTFCGYSDAFIVQFNSSGKRLWATYFGDINGDWGSGIACDLTGNIYITGTTGSYFNIATPGAYQYYLKGQAVDAFIAKFHYRDISVDTLLKIPKEICKNDSFKVDAVVTNRFTQPDSNIAVTLVFSGPTTLKQTIVSTRKILAGKQDTLQFTKWFKFTVPGTYKVTAYLDPSDNNPFNDTFRTTLIVHPTSIPGFTFKDNCPGTPTSFTNTSTLTSGTATYKWFFGDGGTSTVVNPQHVFSGKGTYAVKLVTITGKGCKDSVIQLVVMDTIKPDAPIITSATVLTFNSNRVYFQRSVAEVVKYYIYGAANNGSYNLLDSINATTAANYVWDHKNINTANVKWCYYIVSKRACGNILSLPSVNHCVINLKTSTTGCSNNEIVLNWSGYEGWSKINKTEIYRTTAGGSESLLTTLTATASTYKDQTVSTGVTYCYRVKVYEDGGSSVSFSNQSCRRVYFVDTAHIYTASKIVTSAINGAVLIKWKNQSSTPYISHYNLYYSSNGTGYTLLAAKIPAATDSFLHFGLNTRTQNHFYYLQTVDSCGNISAPSNIHKTIDLTVNIGQLKHDLSWTKYRGFDVRSYYIQRFTGGKFVTVDTVPSLDSFSTQFPAPCNHHIIYRLAAVDSAGRMAFSDTMGRLAIDTVFANAAKITNATVLNSNAVEVAFTGSDSPDVYAYAIQRSIDGIWGTAGQVIFTTPGDKYTFTDKINTLYGQLCYTILTLDSCLNTTLTDTFCLIQLKGAPLNLGNALQWHKFKGYGINQYSVLVYNGNGWDTLQKVNGKDSLFVHQPLACNVPKTYKIAGKEEGGKRLTLSDEITLTPFDTVPPPQPIIHFATVLPGNKIQLNWHWDKSTDVKYFEVWRDNADGNFKLLNTVVYNDNYLDADPYITPQKNAYSYYVIAIDSCNLNNRSVPSLIHKTIVPNTFEWSCRTEAQISWSPYIGFEKNASVYKILRSENGTDFTEIDEVSFGINNYNDTTVTLNQLYFYKIQAFDSANGFSSFSDTIRAIPKLYPAPDTARITRTTVERTEANTGVVIVEWERAALTDTLLRGYYLYYSTYSAAGPFTFLANINNLNTTKYAHYVNTVDEKPFYKVVIYNSCTFEGMANGPQRPINLELNARNLEADLYWEKYYGFPIEQYELRRIEDKTAYKTIAVFNPTDTFYNDINIRCGHEYAWQVIGYNYSYNFVTLSDSVWFTAFDTIAPPLPVINYVSVSSTSQNGRIDLSFTGNNEPNKNGYNLYRKEAGATNFTLNTKLNNLGTAIIYSDNINTTAGPVSYYLTALDSCGNESKASTVHTTVFLSAEAFEGYNQLNWTQYEGWNVKEYHIYRNGQKYFSVPGNIFSYRDSLLICTTSYIYLIIAVSEDGITTSNSNTDEVIPKLTQKPLPVYLKAVSVSNPNKEVSLSWTASPSYDLKHYAVYMRSGYTGRLIFIDSTTGLNYIHKRDTIEVSDCYYIYAVDHCNKLSEPSNRGCIIVLNGKSSKDLHQLSWNEYSIWNNGVENYKIYKKTQGQNWSEIAVTNSLAYKDVLKNDSFINHCYQVEAIESQSFYDATSRSTVVCLNQDPIIFMPNVFTPDLSLDVNDFFGPKGTYIKNYQLQIFNRWGELVYETRSGKPWNGTYKGTFVQEGVYMYLLTVESFTPNGVQRLRGSVIVLR